MLASAALASHSARRMRANRARSSGRCARCAVRQEHCICAHLAEPIVHVAEVVIIRHAHEQWRPTNTARLAATALAHARVHEYGALEAAPLDCEALIASLPAPVWLLYPTAADDLLPPVPVGAPSPGGLVVLDGTWSQTQRLVRRHPALATLPRAALPMAEVAPLPELGTASGATLRLRQPAQPGRRLTVDAIAGYLALWESAAAAEALGRVYRHFVAATLAGRGDVAPAAWVAEGSR